MKKITRELRGHVGNVETEPVAELSSIFRRGRISINVLVRGMDWEVPCSTNMRDLPTASNLPF